MGILDFLSINLFTMVLTFLVLWYSFFKWRTTYWKRRGLQSVETKFPFGSFTRTFFLKTSFGEQCSEFYAAYKPKGHKHVGMYTFSTPIYLAIDLEIIKNIVQKDFDHFVERGLYHNEAVDPISAHLFSVGGTKWRKLRVKFTPTFTSGKMRMMLPMVVECGNQLKEAMDTMVDNNEPIDIKDFSARFTTNVIGSCAFGIECNCFKDVYSEFRMYGKRVFSPTWFETVRGSIGFDSPELARFLKFKMIPDDVSQFYLKLIKETVEYRETNGVTRKDFLQLLIDIKNTKNQHEHSGLTMDEVAAQCFVFFLAGYETSASLMTFCLFELANHPDIQQRVREEIELVINKHNGEITYDALAEMSYLGQVIDESLRKYPALTALNRKSVKPYQIPNTDVVLEKSTAVFIPVWGLHHDPEYFPNPHKYDPERFSEENKKKIVPFTYMPFGEGPRNCIARRFGIMESKVGLIVLLKNYKFTLNSKTKTPLRIDPLSFVTAIRGTIWLNAEKIKT